MPNREYSIRSIEEELKNRKLLYFGTRGADAEPLLEIENFSDIFSQIAPLSAASISEVCLENITKRRVDLNRYNIDIDDSDYVKRFNENLLKAFDQETAVIPYRPCSILTSTIFPSSRDVLYLGIFNELQKCFEFKPWVESCLKSMGILTVPWQYFSDFERNLISEMADKTPIVIRINRTDGGAGLALIRNSRELENKWVAHSDGFIAVSKYMQESIPLNINACISNEGKVILHAPSVQIIGPQQCTSRRFGYCGNDFGIIKDVLNSKLIEEYQLITNKVGEWLYKNGYRGAFGIDALLFEEKIYLTEINPRFQGSSFVSSLISKQLEHPDIFLDHISAFLHIEPLDVLPLQEIVYSQPPYSHIVQHNTASNNIYIDLVAIDKLPFQCRLMPPPGITIEPEGIIFQAVYTKSVLGANNILLPEVEDELQQFDQFLLKKEPCLF